MTLGIVITTLMGLGSFIAIRHCIAARKYDEWLDQTAPVVIDNKL